MQILEIYIYPVILDYSDLPSSNGNFKVLQCVTVLLHVR